jgi:hypothetical protein
VFPLAQDPLSTTEAHQDFPYVQGGVDGLTTWVSLGDTPRELGGLAVLRGSARHGIYPIRGHGHYRCGATVMDEHSGDWLTTNYRAGDVLLFHSLTVHSSTPNRTECVRLSIDFRFRAVTEPILEDELQPAYHPNVPGWPELTASWSSRRWTNVPTGIQVTGFAEPAGGVPVPASRLIGTGPGTLVTATQPVPAHSEG